jgi:O-glycosyl hydrolase
MWIRLALAGGLTLIGLVTWQRWFSGKATMTTIITINPQVSYQTMEGFGASTAWWAQVVGGWEAEREQVIDWLFDPQVGIGLTIVRYNLGGGEGWNIADPWRRAETFEVAAGQYDWSRDANAVWVVKAAQQRGVEHVVAFVNSPPARMTVSGLTTGEKDGKSNLRPDMYADFVRYLVDVVRHLRQEEGLSVTYLSPINEPQWPWSYKNGQEGCHYNPQEVVAVTRLLVDELAAADLPVLVSAPELAQWKQSEPYVDALLGDSALAEKLPHLAVHSYWSDREDKQRLVRYLDRHYPGTTLWMSEWTEMKEGRDIGMESALVLANAVQDDLVLGGVTSWQYWIAVSKYYFRDGLIYVDEASHRLIPTQRLWALGNFSRFVRPGAVRVEALCAGQGQQALNISAFRSADGQTLVLIVVNNAHEPQSVRLELPQGWQIAEAYETSAERSLQLMEAGSSNEWLFAPQSVTTVVLR